MFIVSLKWGKGDPFDFTEKKYFSWPTTYIMLRSWTKGKTLRVENFLIADKTPTFLKMFIVFSSRNEMSVGQLYVSYLMAICSWTFDYVTNPVRFVFEQRN